jgi:hypothetical protein
MDRKLREQQNRSYEVRYKYRCLERGYVGIDFCELLLCEGAGAASPASINAETASVVRMW